MKKVVVLLLGITFILSGCGKQQEIPKEGNSKIDITKFDYVEETDAQVFFNNAPITKGQEGYYYWEKNSENGEGRLMYYDTATSLTVPLCNNSDCEHNDKNCNAYFGYKGEMEEEFVRNYVQYYEGDVYILGHDSEYTVNLYKVAADGSSWEKYMELYRMDMSAISSSVEGGVSIEWTVPEILIHRGYVYYLDKNETVQKLRRIELGGKESEILFEVPTERSEINAIKPYGEYVFLNYSEWSENEGYTNGKTYAYHIGSESLIEVMDEVSGAYYVADDKLYYSTVTSIKSFDFITKESTILIDNSDGFVYVKADSKYLYTYNWRNKLLSVYTTEGELVTELKDNDVMPPFYFGD